MEPQKLISFFKFKADQTALGQNQTFWELTVLLILKTKVKARLATTFYRERERERES